MTDGLNELMTIDAIGKPCPMPLLMLKKALKTNSNAQFLLKSSDPHSQNDVTRYCEIHQLKCETNLVSNHEFHYIITQ
jgi:tRNA 2-thiouridine synthesizing protein A